MSTRRVKYEETRTRSAFRLLDSLLVKLAIISPLALFILLISGTAHDHSAIAIALGILAALALVNR